MTLKVSPKIAIISATAGLIAISAFFIFKYYQVSRELSSLKSDPTQLSSLLEAENNKIIDKLKNLIDLPPETPRIITITDKSSIANEPLLAKAEAGDTFLIYSQARKAILYRPSQNKIIDVIPISAPSSTPSVSPSPTPKTNINL